MCTNLTGLLSSTENDQPPPTRNQTDPATCAVFSVRVHNLKMFLIGK